MEPPKSLDLTNFPHIDNSATDLTIEAAKRSFGMSVIEKLMEELLKTMNSYISDLKKMDSQAKLLEQQKSELVEIEKDLRYQQHQLELKEKELNEQLEYIESFKKEPN